MRFSPDSQVPLDTPASLRAFLYDLIRRLSLVFAAKTNRDSLDDLVFDDATKGVVLKDTQSPAHYWRVTVDNTGTLVVSDLGTTKP